MSHDLRLPTDQLAALRVDDLQLYLSNRRYTGCLNRRGFKCNRHRRSDATSAGRTPGCSCPQVGFRSTIQISPRGGIGKSEPVPVSDEAHDGWIATQKFTLAIGVFTWGMRPFVGLRQVSGTRWPS
jgi:hypothetical protein